MSKQQDIIQFNCCGLRAQYHLLSQLISEVKPKFVLLQELMIKKAEDVKFKGYTLIIKIFESWRKPSVGILIADGIQYDEIDLPADIPAIGINTYCNGPISLFSFYDSVRNNKLSVKNLKIIIKSGKFKPIIMGDFNTKSSMWDNNLKHNLSTNTRENVLIEFVNNSNCVILNDGSSTRISPIYDQLNSALDLTIVDESFFNKFVWSVADICYGSDHLPTMLSSKVGFDSVNTSLWNTNKTDWKIFDANCDLAKIFDLDEDNDDIDVLDNKLTQQILIGLEASTPLIQYNAGRRKKPPWFDDELSNMKKQKRKFLKMYASSQTKENLINLKKINAQYKRLIVFKKRDSWEKFVSETEDLESKDMWKRLRIINGKSGHNSIRNLEDEDGNLIEDRREICNMLGSFYQSVSSPESLTDTERRNLSLLKNNCFDTNDDDFPEMSEDFKIHELLAAIRNTKNSAPGLDGFKYIIFKNLTYHNQLQLLKFFNKIWNSGRRPITWNISKVIPIPKIKNLKYAKDTRPINLFNTTPKLFDKMVNTRLIYILEKNKFLDDQQFGFRKNKQTLSSMLILNSNILNAFESKSHLQLISFDIFKAFDRVWPETIVKKLQDFKIGGKIVAYLSSFLNRRKFTVNLGHIVSDVFFTELGVPQGSPLSSTLFLIAFQGILDELKEIPDLKYSAYADDLIIYSDNIDQSINQQILQDSIDLIVRKGQKTGLKFSYDKTKSIHFCPKRNGCPSFKNYLERKVIKEVSEIKILGIVLQSKFKFTLHIKQLKLRLSKDLQFIKIISNSKYGLSQDIIQKIVTSVVISKIRYGIELYGNTTATNKKVINVMINHFNRCISLGFITSPVVSLNIITGIHAFEHIMEKANLLTAARMRANSNLDYPVYPTNNCHFNIHQRFITSTAENNSTLLEVATNKSIISPLASFENQIFLNIFKKNKDDLSSQDVKKMLKDFINQNNFINILFTDGSKMEESSSYAVTTTNDIIYKKKLHNRTSVFTAEALGILKAIKLLKTNFPYAKNAIISDSQSVLSVLYHKSNKENVITKEIMLNLSNNISIIWVPGHFGIRGNELADTAAGEVHDSLEDVENIITHQDFQIFIKQYLELKLQTDWNLNIENKLFRIHPMYKMNHPTISISRKQTMILNRLKIGHSYLTHKFKIDKGPEPICEWCDQLLTIEHIFECNSNNVQNLKSKFKLGTLSIDLFDNSKLESIFAFLKELNYYHLI